MDRLKTALVAAAGGAIGIVTLRAVRNRRSSPREEAETAIGDALDETEAAVEHATAAAEHARVAGRKATEHVVREVETGRVEAGQPTRRLRRAGKGWIRR